MILSKLHRRHNISLFLIFAIYGGIFIMVYAAESAGGWGLKLLALIFIAALQVHLQILHHEGAHFNLHPNRRLNDLISDLFCSLPFLGFTKHYRFFHMEHHKHLLNKNKDPEIEFYKEQGYEFKGIKPYVFLLDFCGYHYLQFFFSYNLYLIKSQNPRLKLNKKDVINAILVLSAVIFAHKWVLFYWFLPQATIQFGLLKLQGYGEHKMRNGAKTYADCTNDHKVNLLTMLFVYPLNSNLHLEHHLNPNLPWYGLGQN